MVPDREGIHRRPKPPARPLPHVRVYAAGDNKCDQEAQLGRNDGEASLVSAVADIRKAKHHAKSKKRPNGRESVSLYTIESKVPSLSLVPLCLGSSKLGGLDVHDDSWRVGGKRTPSRKDAETAEEVKPAPPMRNSLPHKTQRYVHPLGAVALFRVVSFEPLL